MRSWLDRCHIMTKIQRFPFTRYISNATGLHVPCSESWIVTKWLPFLGMNILKISFNTAYIQQKKHLFIQKSWGITTSRKQTHSFYVRKEIKTLVICECYLHTCRLNQLGHMDALESVYWFLLFWTGYCEFYPMFSTVLIRLTMYGFARS